MKKSLVLSFLLGGSVLSFNCQDTDFEEIVSEENTSKISKLIDFKGLQVNHRFATPVEELKITHDLERLKALYNKMRRGAKKNSTNHTGKIAEEELPDGATILEAAKVVLPDFPYEEIEGYTEINRVNKEFVDVGMIENDFSDLTLAEIEEQAATVDQYYSRNLDYLVLKEIAHHPEKYTIMTSKASCSGDYDYDYNSVNEFLANLCVYDHTMILVTGKLYGYVRSAVAFLLAGGRAKTSSEENYHGLDPGDTRRDAYRHTLWNALLAQYYWTIIPSKSRRMSFAKLVSNHREILLGGSVDSIEMDFHNNAIGRELWSQHTGYRKVFGITVGLRKPDTSELKTYCLKAVAYNSCYIVKDYKGTVPNSKYTTAESKEEILKTSANTVVYFKGPIAPQRVITTVSYDYSGCDYKDVQEQNSIISTSRQGIITANNDPLPLSDDCIKRTYSYTYINACFVSKDPNYNPYLFLNN